VAAARSSQLPAGALDTPDRLLDLDGHAWTVGSGADGPGVRRATASATSRLDPSRHLTDRRRSPLASHQQAIALRRLANPQLPLIVVFRPPLRIARLYSRSPPSLPSCPTTPSRLPPPRLRPSPSRLGLPHPITQASRGRGVQRVSGGHPFLEAQACSEI
jgi:hypothetical protein